MKITSIKTPADDRSRLSRQPLKVKTVGLMMLSAGIGALVALLLCDGEGTVAAMHDETATFVASAAPATVPDALERALRKRIRTLEDELAAVARADVVSRTNLPPNQDEVRPMPRQADFRPPNPREMMENLKRNDPQRYEEFRRHLSERRNRRLARTNGRLAFLGSVDTSEMTREERANHEKLQELLAARENLPEPGDASDEEMRQRHQLEWEIREASATERTTLLKQTASMLGLDGDEAAVLTETIQEVLSATESDRHGPPGPPPAGKEN